MDVVAFLREKARRTEEEMRRRLDALEGVPPRLDEAMRYSLFAGGKRLRPALALGAAETVSGEDSPALPAACALEMAHTYSLIHDDLPAMDNDDLRRGKPTSHVVYGEALAILAGDALLTLAFEVLASAGRPEVVAEMAHAAGAAGMAGGQLIDLDSEDKPLQLDELRDLHARKTGALIRASVRMGAMLAGGSDEELETLTRYGDCIGLAFQIADDILDVIGTAEALGKPVGSDAERKKSTYPALLGLERSRALALEAVEEAEEALEIFGDRGEAFRALARFIVERES